MQNFEFEKALMQKHYNGKDFLDTKQFPKSKFTGKITNTAEVNFSKDGIYPVLTSGSLTIKNISILVYENGTIKAEGDKITLQAKIKILLADYNIVFLKGKPSTNIAKEVEVSVKSIYLND